MAKNSRADTSEYRKELTMTREERRNAQRKRLMQQGKSRRAYEKKKRSVGQ